MSAKVWSFLILLPWVSAPLFVLEYLCARTSLPARLVIHFDAEGRPNGWMSRGHFFWYQLITLLFILGSFSLVCAPRGSQPKSLLLVAVYYAVVAGLSSVTWQLVQYNQHRSPVKWIWIIAAALGAAAVPLAAALVNKPTDLR